MTIADNTIPSGKWEFNSEVASVFEDMLSRSIPQYEVMRRACFDLACHYRQEKTSIIDLGCSRGDALVPLIKKYGCHNNFLGIEVSRPMLEVARSRFSGMINAGVVDIREMDLRKEFPPVSASICLSILTIQFIPIEYRQSVIQKVFDSLLHGGAFIFVEKVLGHSASLNDMMVEAYLDMKSANGYTQEQIDRKRISLEGVLVPVTAKWNEELLYMAGFKQVDCFWRWMNFAGWVGVK